MSRFYTTGEMSDRKAVVRGALQPLAKSLQNDLDAAMASPLYVPEQKALLSREGGRCPRDGAMLKFNPYSPHEHGCPACGAKYTGELHDRFWIYWYQLWLAERAVHAAALGSLTANASATRFALDILDAYTDRYPKYPNADNALGPTRPFFSTYLESIWLLQLCVAADLLGTNDESAIIGRFKDMVVEPSAALIRSFDEGLSNRQVWNNAALIGAYRFLDRDGDAESVIWAESGLVTHLTSGLLADGMWYEGENYHFFAHRGLWYCMQLASRLDVEIPEDLVARYDVGFRAPFLTALPDLTFPSRRDSQYAVSLRQWRFAEMCELGLARGDDKILRGMLARLYADDIASGDTGRWASTAEAERNVPAARLDRSDLGWKSLLFARPTLELSEPAPLPSVLLGAQGIGVLRRDRGRVYIGLDYGVSGGGHGHPDRLNLLISDGERRILDDMGTGSYVDPSLHWYRSSLAHNAPFFDGISQPRVSGMLAAWEDRGAAGWVVGRADFDGRIVTRTVVAMPDYALDQMQWAATAVGTFDLPLHIDAEVVSPVSTWTEALMTGGKGDEDGFPFLTRTEVMEPAAGQHAVRLHAIVAGKPVDIWVAGEAPFEIWRVTAPGAPGKPPARFMVLRSPEAVSTLRIIWSWAGRVNDAMLSPNITVVHAEGRHMHSAVEHGWQIEIQVGSAKSTIDLQGMVESIPISRGPDFEESTVTVPSHSLADGATFRAHLGEKHYWKSEQTWSEAGSPTADVAIHRAGPRVEIQVSVNADRTFAAPGALNVLDNEHGDINGAGIQLYLDVRERRSAYVIVPMADGSLSLRPIDGWGSAIPVDGRWRATRDGYEVDLAFEPGVSSFFMDLVVNEKPPERQRRRGQLVLSGGGGNFIYLRGDRHYATMQGFFLKNG
jgi:hypothetical protein